MTTTKPRPAHDHILPQHRPAACDQFSTYLDAYFAHSPRQVITIINLPTAQTTFVARFRDAINAQQKYRWKIMTNDQQMELSSLIVVSSNDGVLLGTRTAIKKHRATPQDIIANNTTKNNEVEIISLDALPSICNLIQTCSLSPQPLFYTNIPLLPDDVHALRLKFPNVIITQDPDNQNKHHFV